jgi:hypothetical protein
VVQATFKTNGLRVTLQNVGGQFYVFYIIFMTLSK